MDITKHDGITFVYNFAVVLSGANIIWQVEFSNRIMLFVVSLLLGLVWTVYFRLRMVRRFADHPQLTGDTDETA